MSPPPEFDPRTVQPVASRYADCAIPALCEISHENENDIQQKLAKFARILGILNYAFEPTLIREFSRIKVYNALTVPVLLYRSKIWTIRKEDKKKLRSVEIKFFRRRAGNALFDYERNEEILEKLEVETFDKKLRKL
jgi:hypothetical protein